ncbi:MAG: hypothetical protein NTW28_00595 [Candidatus Solibacter sp.]|nr:hypothetical protein [Candidatus Solibacter sp.]
MKLLYHVQATDSRFTGEQVVVVNGDFEGWREVDPASGVMWGTLRLEVTGKGLGPIQGIKTGEVWEGAFTGTRMITAGVVRSSFHDVAYGSGGRVEGMHADWHVSLNPVTGVGECQGRILAPAGQ